jgi:hypothetical protein
LIKKVFSLLKLTVIVILLVYTFSGCGAYNSLLNPSYPSSQSNSAVSTTITQKGKELICFLDKFDVEHHWLSGEHVDWKTGVKDSNKKDFTHCSAFVAAVASKLNIDLLNPDESPYLLSNAQQDWLKSKGIEKDWKQINNMQEAQDLANQGYLVLASYKSPDPQKPGHIAILRPFEKDISLLNEEGPQIIQAGAENYNSTSLKEGFKHHTDAWKYKKILYFVHKIEQINTN